MTTRRAPAPPEALEYFRFRGLKTGFDYRDVPPEEHARFFTVAKAMEIGLLKEIRAAVDRALGEGWPFRRFEAELTPALRARGWWGRKEMDDPLTGERKTVRLGSPRRLRTIYRANVRASHAAGAWDRAQRTKQSHPYFVYGAVPETKHCDGHRPWAGTLLPVDHPWWDDHFPPNGWRCKCRVRQVTEAEAVRRGGPTGPPPRNEFPWTNVRTGAVRQVDEGLDPAWDSNPGKHRAEGPLGYLGGDLDADEESFACTAVRSVVDSPILDRFVQEPRGDLPVGVFSRRVRRWLESRTRIVRLSERIMFKQKGFWMHRTTSGSVRFAGHPLTVAEYRLLPRLIERPQVVLRYQPARPVASDHLARRLNLLSEIDGAYYNLVIGRSRDDPARVQMISFYSMGADRPFVDRMIAQAETSQAGQAVFRNSMR